MLARLAQEGGGADQPGLPAQRGGFDLHPATKLRAA